MFSPEISLLWHGVVATASPGVASAYTLDGKQYALNGAMLTQSLDGILRACGRKAAAGGQKRRDARSVKSDR